MARHTGAFPKRELARIWREMLDATLRFEGPFSVAVSVPEGEPGYWDMARDQYGSFAPMTRHASSRGAVEAVSVCIGRRGSGFGLWRNWNISER